MNRKGGTSKGNSTGQRLMLKRLTTALHLSLRLTLITTLALGLWLLIFGAVPLPRTANHFLNQRLVAEGLTWESGQLLYRFPRSIEWWDGRLASRTFPNHPFLTVERLVGEISFRPAPVWDSLTATDLRWRSIAPRSPDGAGRDLIHLHRLSIEHDLPGEMYSLTLGGSGADVRWQGRANLSIPGISLLRQSLDETLPPTERKLPLGYLIPELNARFNRWLDQLPPRDNAALEVDLLLDRGGKMDGSLLLRVPEWRDFPPDWSARDLTARIRFGSLEDAPLVLRGLRMSGHQLHSPLGRADFFYLEHEDTYLWSFPPSLPDHFSFGLAGIEISPEQRVESARGQFQTENHGQFRLDGWVFTPRELALQGHTRNLPEGDWIGHLRGDWQPNLILRHPVLAALLPTHRGMTFFEETVYADLHFTAPQPDQWESLQGFIRARDFVAVGTFFDYIEGFVHLTPEKAEAHRIFARRDDFAADGSARVVLADESWLLELEGTHRPEHINSWFTSWWRNFWADFTFPGEPAQATVRIEGLLSDPDRTKVGGRVTAHHFTYRDQSIDSLTTAFRIGEGVLDFVFPRVVKGDEFASGNLTVQFNPPRNRVAAVEYQFHGQARPVHILPFINPTWQEYGAFAHFPEAPTLRTSGRWTFEEGGIQPQSLALDLEGQSPWTLGSLQFNQARVTARWQDEALLISLQDDDFTQPEGRINSILLLSDWAFGQAPWMELSLSLDTILAEKFLAETNASIRQLVDLINRQNEFDENAAPWTPLQGQLTGELNLSGFPTARETYLGDGEFLLTEGKIASVRLLGILSRLLDLTPIRLTTVDLDEAESQFTISSGILQLNPLKLRGPISGIEAEGYYDLQEQLMDIQARVILLSETGIPLITPLFRGITRPFGYILEVRLTGSADQPNWRLMIDPRNIFSPRDSSLEDFSNRPSGDD